MTTHGNGDSLGVSWGLNFPRLPTLSLTYNQNSEEYSFFGTNQMGSSTSRQFGVHSSYNLGGFRLYGGYVHSTGEGQLPAVLQSAEENTTASSDGYSFGVSHSLPLRGAAVFSYNHSDYNASSNLFDINGGVNQFEGNASFHPTRHWSASFLAAYTDNLAGVLNETILNAGGTATETFTGTGSYSLNLTAMTTYTFPHNIAVSADLSRLTQAFEGQSYGSTMAGGSVSAGGRVLGGSLSGSLSAFDILTDAVGTNPSSSALGLSATVSFSRRFQAWDVNTLAAYYQNQQTVLVSYLTSFYNYHASVSRRIRNLHLALAAGGAHSGFTAQPGTGNSSESFSVNLGNRWLTGAGSYSHSTGNSILTATGILPIPIPPVASQVVLFGGTSYSFSASSSPVRRLLVAFAYAQSKSNTNSSSLTSENRTKSMFGQVQYRFRQVTFNGGYNRLIQGFSSVVGPAQDSTTYFIGVSRWFNWF